VEELKAKRQEARAREAQWARMTMDTDAAIKEQQRRADDFRKAQAAARLAFLQRQAAEKAERDAKLAETYQNKIAPEYFSQFGTSHR
jgi:RIB43A